MTNRGIALKWTFNAALAAACLGILPGTAPRADAVEGLLFGFESYGARQLVRADGGGTGPISASSPTLGRWEEFDIVVLHGMPLVDGAEIQLRCYDNQFVRAEGGGGGAVNCNQNEGATGQEVFTIFHAWTSVAGQPIAAGDRVQIRAKNGMYFRTLKEDGTGPILATASVKEKMSVFQLDVVRGELPKLDQIFLEKKAFPESDFPVNEESRMGGCSFETVDGVFFDEPSVPSRTVIGIITELSCQGSPNGVRVDPEYFRGFHMKNGWHILDFIAPDTSDSGCNSYTVTPAVVGSNNPYVQLHLSCGAFRSKGQNIVSILVAGPIGEPMQ